MQPKERRERICSAPTEAIKRGPREISGLFIFPDRLPPRRALKTPRPIHRLVRLSRLRGPERIQFFADFFSARRSERLGRRSQGKS